MNFPTRNSARCQHLGWVLLAVCCLARGVFSQLPLAIMGPALDTGPDSTLHFGEAAALEGGYQVHTMAVGQSRTNIVELGQTLPAGTYYLMLKVIEYDRYLGAPMHVRVRAGGGAESIVYVNDRDTANRFWTTNYAVIASGSFSNLTCVFTNSHPSLTWTPMFLGLYLGTEALAARDPDRDDVIGTYVWPTATDEKVTYPGNLQRNGGFEAGLGSEWLFYQLGGFRSFPIQSMLTTNAYEGQFALEAPAEGRLYSQPFDLQPGRRYVISMRYFGSASQAGDILGLVSPVQTVPGGASNTARLIMPAGGPVGASWHNLSVTGSVPPYPNNRPRYQWTVHMRAGTRVDNFSIAEGDTLGAFVERSPLTLGHALSDSLFTNSAPVFPLVIHNSSGGSLAGRVVWEVRDSINRLISEGVIEQTFPAGNTTNNPPINVTRWGWYRFRAWAQGMDGSRMEKPFAFLSGIPSQNFGTHAQWQPWQLGLLAKAGVRHQRGMSAQQSPFQWNICNPSAGVFVPDDAAVTNALDAGQTILGVLGQPSAKGPSWVGSTIDDTWMGHWTNYVDTLVRRYPAVKLWEVANEPNAPSAWQSDLAGYTNLWIRAWHVVTNANPDAQLVGFGGAQLAWVQSITNIFPTWRDYLGPDRYISTHLYTDDPVSGGDVGSRAGAWRQFALANGVTVLNTEAGDYDTARWWSGSTGTPVWGYLSADLWISAQMGTPLSNQRNALLSLGYLGTETNSIFYIYDARLPVVSDVFGVHTTILSPDDSISPKGVAALALGSFLGPGRGNISADAGTIAMLFGGAAPVCALWRTNLERYEVELPSAVTVYDTYGNQVATSQTTVQLGRAPVFVGGLSESALSNAVVAMSGSTATDTVAPHVSIEEWPLRPFSNPGEVYRLRGLAIDEEEQPWKTSSTVPEDTLSYSWHVPGLDNGWTEWTTDAEREVLHWPAAAHTIYFRARDPSGNIGVTQVSNGQVWHLESLTANTLESD